MLPPDKEKGSKWGDWYSFISPGIPAVQDYLVSVFKEVVTNYDVDGIHFDYIRYPSEIGDFSYDKVSLERFKRKYGHTPDELPAQWVKWRSDQVTAIERRIYYECTAIRPNLVVSAATVRKYEKARSRYYQRSFDWMEEGTLDVAIPMQYTTDDEEFRVCAEDYVKHSYGHMVYPGIGVHRLKTPKHLIRQIDISREVGCKGIGFFAYKSFFPNHKPNKFAEALKKGPFTERALPPQMPWKNPNPKLTPTRRTELKIP